MDVARDFENIMIHILKSFPVTQYSSIPVLKYQGKEYDLSAPWDKISLSEAFEKYAGIDTETMLEEKKLRKAGEKKGYQVDEKTTWEEIWNQILANEIEPKLGQDGPTILYDYPVSQAALSKKKASDPRFAERFEVFMAGMELGNCFSELTDSSEQVKRCLEDLKMRKELGKTEYPMDTDFIEALKMGMPETGGIAVGVDRLVALFADAPDIADTMYFPVTEMFNC